MNYRDIIIEDILVGDIHYEYVNGIQIECEVITLPVFNEESQIWTWTSKNTLNDNEIQYKITPILSEVTFATEDTL